MANTNKPPTKGIKTSEFWLSVGAMVIGALVASDGRVLIRLFENASAPEGVSTISRAEAETMLEDTVTWWGPIRPRNL